MRWAVAVDHTRAALQIRVVRVCYRGQAPLLSGHVLRRFRERSVALLDQVDPDTLPDDLAADLAAARREVSGDR